MPGDRHPRVADRRERVVEPDRSVVERVVVRHVHDVDTGGLQRGERRRRRTEVEVLPGDGFAAVGDRRLEVDHREVGLRQHRRHRIEHVLRVVAHLLGERRRSRRRTVLGVPGLGKVHVAREREGHRVPVAACAARCDGGRGDGRGRRRAGDGGRARSGGDASLLSSSSERQDERAHDDDHRRQRCQHVSPHSRTLRARAAPGPHQPSGLEDRRNDHSGSDLLVLAR